MKNQTTTEWLEYFPKKVYDEAMANIKLQKMEHILNWEFISGIAAVSLAFDFTKSKEGAEYWYKLVCEAFGN